MMPWCCCCCRAANTLTTVANMSFPRWYPSATLLPDGRIYIMGGTQVTRTPQSLHACVTHISFCMPQSVAVPVTWGHEWRG